MALQMCSVSCQLWAFIEGASSERSCIPPGLSQFKDKYAYVSRENAGQFHEYKQFAEKN